MARASQPTTADLKRDFDALKADLGSLTRELRAFAEAQERGLARRAAETAQAATEGLRESGERQMEHLKELAEQATSGAEDLVRQHPAGTVAGAAALGFLLGALAARR